MHREGMLLTPETRREARDMKRAAKLVLEKGQLDSYPDLQRVRVGEPLSMESSLRVASGLRAAIDRTVFLGSRATGYLEELGLAERVNDEQVPAPDGFRGLTLSEVGLAEAALA